MHFLLKKITKYQVQKSPRKSPGITHFPLQRVVTNFCRLFPMRIFLMEEKIDEADLGR